MTTPIYLGQSVRIDGTFEQPGESGADELYDPVSTPILTLRHTGTGTVETPAVVRQETGRYYADFTVAHSGRWAGRWHIGGPQPAAREFSFNVEMSAFPD